MRTSKTRKRLKYAIVLLAAIVIFTTTYSLILPAITLESTEAEIEPGLSLHSSDEISGQATQDNSQKTEKESADNTASQDQDSTGDNAASADQDPSGDHSALQGKEDLSGKDNSANQDNSAGKDSSAEKENGTDQETTGASGTNASDKKDAEENGADVSGKKDADDSGKKDAEASEKNEKPAMTFEAEIKTAGSTQTADGVVEEGADSRQTSETAKESQGQDKQQASKTAEETKTQDSRQTSETVKESQVQDVDLSDIVIRIKAEAEEGTFPAGTTMKVKDVAADKAVQAAISDAVDGSVKSIQAVDITFYDKEGNEIEPAKDIRVTITSDTIKTEKQDNDAEPVIVHIPDKGDAEIIRAIDENKLPKTEKPKDEEVVFENDAFSVYAVVYLETPETAQTVPELDGNSYYISWTDGNNQAGNNRSYMTDDLAKEKSGNKYIFHAVRTFALDNASQFTFELTDADEFGNNYYIYTYDDAGNKRYLNMTSPVVVNEQTPDTEYPAHENYPVISFDEEAKTKYTVDLYDVDAPGIFRIYHIDDIEVRNPGKSTQFNRYTCYLLNANGNRFYGYKRAIDRSPSSNNKSNNDRMTLTAASTSNYDPYGLDGQTYGILWNNDMTSATGMMTTTGTSNQTVTLTDEDGNIIKDENNKNVTVSEKINMLKGQTATVRVDPIGREDIRYIANNSDITMWSFACCGPMQYYITAEVDGELKYVRFDDTEAHGNSNKGVSLVSEPDERCRITVTAGTGVYSGKYKFSSCGRTLRVNGTNFYTEPDTTTNANQWMYFAEKSNLNDDDFVAYTAEKVSVSGTADDETGTMNYDVQDGDQIIIYTRIWNETTLKYEYYAIDYDGKLVRAYESGDTISWVGSKVNTMLWNFTEYYNDDGTPNYYYELQNAYSGKYLAPQVSGEGFLSDNIIGLNLNGRRNEEYYTSIIAWDDPYYDYASLKALNYQLTSAPLSQADTFYFAKMKVEETEDHLTTVSTIDNNQYGITVKMQDYNNALNKRNRDSLMWDVMGDLAENGTDTVGKYSAWAGKKDLLTKNIDAAGYPTATLSNRSLSDLFDDTATVNQLFLTSTYQETGYFEYDCSQNFAHLITSEDDKWYGKDSPSGGTYGVGDFVVYDQLGTTTQSGADRQHGNFFPYNDLTEGYFASWVNSTNINNTALSSLDPRYGEKLYAIKAGTNGGTKWNGKLDQADYYFGMEMSASFMQTANGLDDWGHDLIFEFSGDDDFWLYVDDMLVLDLGGVHYALSGSVNFRTGVVTYQTGQTSWRTTNLRTMYEEAYKEKHAGDEEALANVEEWLNGIFKEGTSVFKDYSAHTMRMFYMERDAGASNLHMRFNLAPYTAGEVLLQKQVSGTESVDESLTFPFQIWYEDKSSPVNPVPYVKVRNNFSVKDSQTGDPIPYQETYTAVDGLTYEDVYLLHPGQIASISLPDEGTKYYIVECGQNTNTYDAVTVNGETVEGTAASAEPAYSAYKDYSTQKDAVSARKKVIYNNHVSETAQHSLIITKKLWREYNKTTEIPASEDATTFRFRICIGQANGSYTVYNTGKYYVKDAEGNYCIYQNGGFVSTGKKVFSELGNQSESVLVKSEQERATFHTSPSGAIDKIPSGYSIEIPNLMEGTAFLVEERSDEIPAGYNLIEYERGRKTLPEGERANAGVIHEQDETIVVHNQHGYGLTVNKIWSDAAFMDNHDHIYFAVYIGDSLTPVDGSVRQLGTTQTTMNWFFPELESGKTLNDYVVYEVILSGDYTVGADGVVTLGDGCTVTKIKENNTITVGGTSNEHGYSANYDYTASYSREVLSATQLADTRINSRTDTVTNARPGIKLLKTDLSGNPLEGATFTLVKGNDATSRKTFTSDAAGLIAVAYLTAGEIYTLKEVSAPYQYLALVDSLEIKVENGILYVGGQETAPEGAMYTITQEADPTAEKMPAVSIKNRAFTLKAIKQDAVSGVPIPDVTFALYREVTDYYSGNSMPDYNPMEGFEALVTDEHGVIPKINLTELPAGTYYLRETNRPTTYQMPDYDIRMTIAKTGQISIQKAVSSYDAKTKAYTWTFSDLENSEAAVTTDADGNVALEVKNAPAKGVQILKIGDGNKNLVLPGASFALYKRTQLEESGQPKEGESAILTGTTDQDGILNLGVLDSNMEYYLFETEAPAGYNMLSDPIRITSMSGGKIAAYSTAPLEVETVKDGDTEIYRIQVSNASGYELPAAGGPGTTFIYILGMLLAGLAGAGLVMRRRSEKIGKSFLKDWFVRAL